MDGLHIRRRGGFQLSVPTFELAAGITLLSGANGSGKSTLLEALSGLHLRRLDELAVCGLSMKQRSSRAAAFKLMGYVPQALVLPSRWTVRDAGWLKRVSPTDAATSARELSEKLEFSQFLGRRIGALSGGFKRRVLVAQAMIAAPAVLLLDEPFAGLDQETSHLLRTVLTSADAAPSILLTDHGRDAADIADTQLTIAGGVLEPLVV
ncbi:MAG: ATP-binding cassette domain-containing protein [Propionibacteriales bacterium]|nr:ATP-binding cassette domain-containing protein [Propionibacteriales bacterium]